jgi:carbon monoxide dehydrogenase subunit G
MDFEVQRVVGAPAERVWEIVADVANSADVVSAIESVELVVGPSPVGVGTTWRETRLMMGRRATEEMTVSAVDPGRSYTVRAHVGGTEMESTVSVDPEGVDEAIVRITVASRSTSAGSRLLGATVGRAFGGTIRKALEADLADIASAAELGHAGEGDSGADAGGRPFGP